MPKKLPSQRSNLQSKTLNNSNKFQALLDCSEIMFVEIDCKGIVTLVNNKACKVLGYSESEILGKNWFDNFLPKRILKEILPIRDKLLSGEIKSAEYYENPILTKNNDERLIYWHNAIIRNSEGKIISHLSSGEDITERKKTENLLKESEERFRIVADFTHDWEYWIDKNNSFIYVSPSCHYITGYEPNDFYTDNLLLNKIIHPDDLENFNFHKHNIDENGQRIPIDFRIITRNNKTEWISHVCQDVFDNQGKFLGIRGSNRLVTYQKIQELHNKLLSNIVEQSPASIVITNLNGEIEYVNKSFIDITKYSFIEAIGQNPSILKSNRSNPDIYPILWETITNGDIWKGEFINKRKNEEEYFEKAVIAPLIDDNGKIVKYFAIKEDITLQKKAELLLKESKEKLKIANATKDKFFSIIAHDLRSPFNSIIGFSELLLDEDSVLDPKQKDHIVKLIAESSKNTFNLLENLLNWSRSQTGNIQFKPDYQNLKKLINDTFVLAESIAKQKNIRLSNIVDSDIVVYVDENMLKTVLRNLISNAIKFTSKDGNVKVLVTKKQKNVNVSVIDSGIGIKKEKLQTIFNEVNFETTLGTENEKGHGLGLLLCKEFIEKHGSKIIVESEEGMGSNFSFTLPLVVKREL
jgi:PAS domain S-box-containing protein